MAELRSDSHRSTETTVARIAPPDEGGAGAGTNRPQVSPVDLLGSDGPHGTWNEEGGTGMAEPSLYERLGGVFAIAAVIDHFSDAVVKNPSSANHRRTLSSVSGIPTNSTGCRGSKFMRTLWVCNVAGGPFTFAATKPGTTALGLEEAHRELQISPEEFDEVAAELGRTLDHFGVHAREKDEVLSAFAAHKGEVTEGSMA